MRVGSLLVLTLLCLAVLAAPAAAQTTPAGYVGASVCKSCHGDVYTAWERTKHAAALNRLSPADREGGACIGCHVTGSAQQIAQEGAKPSMPGVQCESCHGPGQAHVDSANAGGPTPNLLTRAPSAADCQHCHNDKGPHFKGFLYDAMVRLVHRAS
jgi:hypothetical protein